jgi:hypothetical protein
MLDAETKHTFLTQRRENRRARELAARYAVG